MKTPTIEQLKQVYVKKGYNFFEKGDYNLNIIGIRANSDTGGAWDDTFLIVYKEKNQWKIISHIGTTDPGQTELINPSFQEAKINGTAIMVEGQYSGLWELGKHRGWDALVQKGSVKLYRDNNRDNIIDKKPSTIKLWNRSAGINFHPYWGTRKWYDFVYNWSAGCQVPMLHAESEDWIKLVRLFKISAKLWGNSFTYTLLNEKDFN